MHSFCRWDWFHYRERLFIVKPSYWWEWSIFPLKSAWNYLQNSSAVKRLIERLRVMAGSIQMDLSRNLRPLNAADNCRYLATCMNAPAPEDFQVGGWFCVFIVRCGQLWGLSVFQSSAPRCWRASSAPVLQNSRILDHLLYSYYLLLYSRNQCWYTHLYKHTINCSRLASGCNSVLLWMKLDQRVDFFNSFVSQSLAL